MNCFFKNVFRFLLIFLLFSCNENKNTWYKKITLSEIKETPILISSNNGTQMGKPIDLLLNDSILFIMDEKSDQFIHILKSSDLKVLGSMGVKGKGPGELISLFDPMDLENRKLWFYDSKLIKYLGYDIDSLLTFNKNYKPIGNEIFVDNKQVLFKLDWLNRNTIIGYGFSDFNGRFSLINLLNDSIKNKGSIPPKQYDNIPNYIHKQAYDGVFKVKPDKQKVVFANLYSDLIEIYDSSLNDLIKVKTDLDFFPKYEIINRDNGFKVMGMGGDTKTGYLDLAVNDNRIYALFSGNTFDDEYVTEDKFIHVFDWNGSLIEVLELKKGALSIEVDSESKFLYTIDNTPVSTISKYKLVAKQ